MKEVVALEVLLVLEWLQTMPEVKCWKAAEAVAQFRCMEVVGSWVAIAFEFGLSAVAP